MVWTALMRSCCWQMWWQTQVSPAKKDCYSNVSLNAFFLLADELTFLAMDCTKLNLALKDMVVRVQLAQRCLLHSKWQSFKLVRATKARQPWPSHPTTIASGEQTHLQFSANPIDHQSSKSNSEIFLCASSLDVCMPSLPTLQSFGQWFPARMAGISIHHFLSLLSTQFLWSTLIWHSMVFLDCDFPCAASLAHCCWVNSSASLELCRWVCRLLICLGAMSLQWKWFTKKVNDPCSPQAKEVPLLKRFTNAVLCAFGLVSNGRNIHFCVILHALIGAHAQNEAKLTGKKGDASVLKSGEQATCHNHLHLCIPMAVSDPRIQFACCQLPKSHEHQATRQIRSVWWFDNLDSFSLSRTLKSLHEVFSQRNLCHCLSSSLKLERFCALVCPSQLMWPKLCVCSLCMTEHQRQQWATFANSAPAMAPLTLDKQAFWKENLTKPASCATSTCVHDNWKSRGTRSAMAWRHGM